MSVSRVLILEDEPYWAQQLSDVVAAEGWLPFVHVTLEDALADAASTPASLILIDRNLAEAQDGLDLLPRLKSLEITAPVVVVSALSSALHTISGLDAGADDYVTKPFDPEVLGARLRASMRRKGIGTSYSPVRLVAGLEVRIRSMTVTFQGRSVRLPDQAFSLLELFTERPGHVFSRAEIWARVWPLNRNLEPQHQVIDAAISRLRKALAEVGAENMVTSERGVGYGVGLG